MEFIENTIRGPYAALLVIQVLIISGLLLTLIWLVLFRTRERLSIFGLLDGTASNTELSSSEGENAAEGRDPSGPAAYSFGIPPATGRGSVESPSSGVRQVLGGTEVQVVEKTVYVDPVDMSAKDRAGGEDTQTGAGPRSAGKTDNEAYLHESMQEVKKLNDECSSLRDKVCFLEDKLLEYEIVQEEISSLSSLRLENEKLKEELVAIQREYDQLKSGEAPAMSEQEDRVVDITGQVERGEKAVSDDMMEFAATTAKVDTLLEKLDDLLGEKKTTS